MRQEARVVVQGARQRRVDAVVRHQAFVREGGPDVAVPGEDHGFDLAAYRVEDAQPPRAALVAQAQQVR
ncbi:hypothetical protein OG350_02625 [Streptomyces achromogenes]|uniref:Uncharacterized protein n=1 Tax=Streptomyces achromogenes TaxID=67255 RepID=A0ABZ1KF28_STRAH